ncbi:alpha/beta hydrolase [Fulvivirga sp. M361]|uniref:alpha/beta hydrolase n=1 Tax=Fulvivirga sp. M361 TaxID=2594266 RepID=UPI00117B3A0C|nr:alpha/beta hydrolase [Fulvivirga sp. M361]TRX59236.1 alpha/beta hydrolase [Fulvivirga sp. M361]
MRNTCILKYNQLTLLSLVCLFTFNNHTSAISLERAKPVDISNENPTEWVFKQVDGKELKMSVFLPDNYADSEREFPCILFFHGGGWKGGKHSWHFPDCRYWSKRGVVAVSVDYRLKDRDSVEVPLECVKDAKSAVRFLRANANELKIDTEKIVCAGASAGGQLAAATAMITDPKSNDDVYNLSISCIPNGLILYNPYFKCEEWLSPKHHIVEGLPPTIIFSGGADPVVLEQEMVDFNNSVKQAGNISELYIGKNRRHGFCIGIKKTNRFFYWSLELADQFLSKQGILSGKPMVERPDGVLPLKEEEFSRY